MSQKYKHTWWQCCKELIHIFNQDIILQDIILQRERKFNFIIVPYYTDYHNIQSKKEKQDYKNSR